MLKLFIALAISLPLFASCGSGKCGAGKCGGGKCGMSSKKMEKRFQSVSAKEAKIYQDEKYGKSCSICGMNIQKFYKTSHGAHVHGEDKQYCSIHCVTDDNEYGQGELKDKKVVAVDTLKHIAVEDAFYVIGSNKPATMSRVSKYAFSTKEAAMKFKKMNGGEIKSFEEAYQVALKDFE